jgi:hypothetical protein
MDFLSKEPTAVSLTTCCIPATVRICMKAGLAQDQLTPNMEFPAKYFTTMDEYEL